MNLLTSAIDFQKHFSNQMCWHPNKWQNLFGVIGFNLLSLFPSVQTHSQCRIVLLIVGQIIDLWILVFLLINPPTRGHNSLIFLGKKTNKIWLKHDGHTRTDLALFNVKYFDFWIFVYKYTYQILFACEKFVS